MLCQPTVDCLLTELFIDTEIYSDVIISGYGYMPHMLDTFSMEHVADDLAGLSIYENLM